MKDAHALNVPKYDVCRIAVEPLNYSYQGLATSGVYLSISADLSTLIYYYGE
jgi:hypothetical protein